MIWDCFHKLHILVQFVCVCFSLVVFGLCWLVVSPFSVVTHREWWFCLRECLGEGINEQTCVRTNVVEHGQGSYLHESNKDFAESGSSVWQVMFLHYVDRWIVAFSVPLPWNNFVALKCMFVVSLFVCERSKGIFTFTFSPFLVVPRDIAGHYVYCWMVNNTRAAGAETRPSLWGEHLHNADLENEILCALNWNISI